MRRKIMVQWFRFPSKEVSLKTILIAILMFAAPSAFAGFDAKTFTKPSEEQLKKTLTPLQFGVTQKEDTERPFHNEYWHNEEAGIYVDVVSGEPLFSSKDKFDSGTGWPSFSRPLVKGHLVEKTDRRLLMARTEVRSKYADSHLGHVFDDGPPPTGLRYCMNSASLRFIPASKLKEEGYGEYAKDFESSSARKAVAAPALETAVFAAGCFWGVEEFFRKVDGVVETEVGYAGGAKKNPSYENVSSGATGHAESLRLRFDPKKVSYDQLLELFFKMHDPTTANRQGNDVGTQYRSAIFYQNDAQKKSAEAMVRRITASGAWKKPLTTEIKEAKDFYPAEEDHQKYLVKHPGGYDNHYLRSLAF